MVTFSQGRLPAGPNTGKAQTAAQAHEDFFLRSRHQALAAGGSRAPRESVGRGLAAKLEP